MTVFLADGGIETALTDRLHQELPEFAAFVLLDTEEGRQALRDYYRPFIEAAGRYELPIMLDTPTWRANPDWLGRLGYRPEELERINAAAVDVVRRAVGDAGSEATVVLNGCIGPRFDEYVSGQRMDAAEAEAYHAPQVAALTAAGVDRVTSVTTLDEAEAIGVVRAARSAGVPVAVSFTVGADGRLASGGTLSDAIAGVDAATDGEAIGYLVNCAHPAEAELALRGGGAAERLIGFRLNAARHGDEGAGDPPESFASGLLALRRGAPRAEVFGGCCGTDAPHIVAVAEAALREGR